MKKLLRKVVTVGALAGTVASVGACAYGAMAAAGEQVVIARNGPYGLARKIFVCKVSDQGVMNCMAAENP